MAKSTVKPTVKQIKVFYKMSLALQGAFDGLSVTTAADRAKVSTYGLGSGMIKKGLAVRTSKNRLEIVVKPHEVLFQSQAISGFKKGTWEQPLPEALLDKANAGWRKNIAAAAQATIDEEDWDGAFAIADMVEDIAGTCEIATFLRQKRPDSVPVDQAIKFERPVPPLPPAPPRPETPENVLALDRANRRAHRPLPATPRFENYVTVAWGGGQNDLYNEQYRAWNAAVDAWRSSPEYRAWSEALMASSRAWHEALAAWNNGPEVRAWMQAHAAWSRSPEYVAHYEAMRDQWPIKHAMDSYIDPHDEWPMRVRRALQRIASACAAR